MSSALWIMPHSSRPTAYSIGTRPTRSAISPTNTSAFSFMLSLFRGRFAHPLFEGLLPNFFHLRIALAISLLQFVGRHADDHSPRIHHIRRQPRLHNGLWRMLGIA